MTTLTIRNRAPFPLRKEQKLRAMTHLELYIPAQIMDPPGTPLSELIKLSDDSTVVGLKESPEKPGKVIAIIVRMKPGDEISLGRSSEVAIDGVPEGQAAFEVLE